MVPIGDLIRFIEEDAPQGDLTSLAVAPDQECRARIRAKESGIIAGLEEAEALFSHYGITVDSRILDGEFVEKGAIIMELTGTAHPILLVERTGLDLIGRMSGIATATRRIVERVHSSNTHIRIAATRKTCPGLRWFDKKAVIVGGGDPHRLSLSDQILIKDNHLTLTTLEKAIADARKFTALKKIEVETGTAPDALSAALAGADIIMLDNMSPEEIDDTISLLRQHGLRNAVLIEVSGGINAQNIDRYAALDIDIISIGALTHSVNNFDVSLSILPGVLEFNL